MASGFRRHRYQVQLGKPHGHSTRRPPIRKILVLGQAISRRVAQPRYRVKSKLGKPYGYKTQRPPVRPILVKGQAEFRRVLQPRLYGRVQLRKPRRSVPVVVSPHVRAIQVVKQAVNRAVLSRRFRTRAVLGKPRGYVTRKPPVRKPIVLLQAIGRKAIQRRIKTLSQYIKAHGGIVTPPIPPVPTFVGSGSGGGGMKWPTVGEGGKVPRIEDFPYWKRLLALMDDGCTLEEAMKLALKEPEDMVEVAKAMYIEPAELPYVFPDLTEMIRGHLKDDDEDEEDLLFILSQVDDADL